MEQQNLLVSHIRALRSIERFKYVPFIVIPEVGTGFNHTVLDQAALNQISCYTLHQNNGPIPGVRKDAYMSQQYVLATTDLLNNLRFVLDKDFITVHGHKSRVSLLDEANGTKVKSILNELRKQLCRYGRDEKTGKLSGKLGNKVPDDMTIAFMMEIYYSRVLEEKERHFNPYYDFLKSIESIESGKTSFINSLYTFGIQNTGQSGQRGLYMGAGGYRRPSGALSSTYDADRAMDDDEINS
jgi:hypothetical protein